MTSVRHTDEATPPEDRYLDSARAAILDVGWSRTTLTDIARRADVSRMTLYRRWPETRALLGDLMTREWQAVVADQLPADGALPATTRSLAEAVVGAALALRANPLLRRVVELDPEVLVPYLLHRRGRGQEQLADQLAALLAAGQAMGTVRSGDPARLARTLLLTLQGPVLAAYDETAAADLVPLVHGHLAP